jgi:Ca-activated chloride channel homolog
MIRQLPATGLLAVAVLLAGTAYRKTEEGNRRYAAGAFEDALRAYTEAQLAAPEAPQLHYDLGNVLYRQGNLDEAVEGYTRALLSADPSLAPRAAYNLGNALYLARRFEEAARAYRRSLEEDPADQDAKRNLELALLQLRRRSDPDDPATQGAPPQRDDGADGVAPLQSGSPGGEGSGDRGRRAGGAGEAAGSSRMQPEEAARFLDGLAEREKAALRESARRRGAASGGRSREKDW